MKEILCFMAGFIGGGGIVLFIFLKTCPAIGSLREDQSDPLAPPYLFLELKPGGYKQIRRRKEVRLKIRLESYIPAGNTSAIME